MTPPATRLTQSGEVVVVVAPFQIAAVQYLTSGLAPKFKIQGENNLCSVIRH